MTGISRPDHTWRTLALALLCMLAAYPVRADKSATEVVNEIGIDQKLNAQLPLELPFRDENGRDITLGRYFKEKPVILILAYYRCPSLCNLVLNGTVKALRPLSFDIGKEFEIVTVSIDPDETPELATAKKKTYVDEYNRAGAAMGWHFLTGSKESIDKLAKTVGFRYLYDPNSTQYAHAGGIMVITPQGRVARYFYGVEYPSNDLRLGLIEASNNQIGTLADELKLLCYRYDPVTGKYGLIITRVMQAAGILTVGLLGGFIFISMRRDRRKKEAESQNSKVNNSAVEV